MIEFIQERPADVLPNLRDTCFWFVIRNGQEIYAVGALEPVEDIMGVHLEMKRWSHTALKVMREDWKEVVQFARYFKCRRLIASNTNIEDKRWPRFISHFGFPEPTGILVSQQEVRDGC